MSNDGRLWDDDTISCDRYGPLAGTGDSTRVAMHLE
jgi:hypothetical protein